MKKEFEKLFWDIFRCNGMGEVHEIVTSNALLKNPDNWFPYGGKDKEDKTNFSTFNNQQNDSGRALVEKVTNAIDSLLLKKCKQAGIDPKSLKAPRTMEEAAELFFGIPKGDIGELMSGQRSKLASDNIQIVATGGKDKPDLMFWDNGEGQHPDDFKNTFLSIAIGNKQDVAFVQGQHNMGSTGAVTYCAEPSYQLVASKKANDIFKKEQNHTKNLFGWTLVRKHILTDEDEQKDPWYEYFAIEGETIPQFEVGNLDIGLFGDKQFDTGSFIKLYSYEMPRDAKAAIWSGLWREFNQLLYKPALPFFLYEQRKELQEEKRDNRVSVYGNHVRINDPNKEEKNLLEVSPIYDVIEDDIIGTVSVLSIVFKEGTTQEKQRRYRNYIGRGRSIIYTLNGQVHGAEGIPFITQELGYKFLRKSLLIVIDCSNMNRNFRSHLFMANRFAMREGEQLDFLKEKIKELLRSNKNLRMLNAKIRERMLRGGDDKESKEFILDLMSKVPLDESLTKLLMPGIDLPPAIDKTSSNPSKGAQREKAPKATERFPSVFRVNIKEDGKGQKVKSIPLNGKGVIEFETDVMDDYFYRPQEKGDFQIQILDGHYGNSPNPIDKPSPHRVVDSFDVSKSGPNDGAIRLTLKPKSNLNVGDEIRLNAKLTSPDGDMECIFYVRIIDKKKEGDGKKAEKKLPKLNLPKLIKITKENDDWVQDNGEQWREAWDENSIVHIIAGDDSDTKAVSAIAINMDSKTLRDFTKRRADNEESAKMINNQYVGKVFLHSLFLYTILEKMSASQKGDIKLSDSDDEQSSEELVATIFKRYAQVLLHLDMSEALLKTIGD